MEIIAANVIVGISISAELSIALDKYSNLLIAHNRHGTSINLGPFTQQRAKELGEYLQRLAIHAPEK